MATQSSCRVCSRRAPILASVFQSKNGQIVADLIRNVIPKLIIDKRVGKSSKEICSECLSIIIDANALRVKSIQSEERLLSKETSLDNDNPRCRICLIESCGDLHKIFKFRKGRTTIDAIAAICPVSVRTSDSFSHEICFDCLKTIDAACDLRDEFEDQKSSIKILKIDDESTPSSTANFVDVSAVKLEQKPIIDLNDDCIITNVSTRKTSNPITFVPKIAQKITSKIVTRGATRLGQAPLKKPATTTRDFCHLCKLVFSSKIALDLHNKFKHSAKTFTCRFKDCSLTFNDGPTFRAHVEEVHIRKPTGLDVKFAKTLEITQPRTQRIIPATKAVVTTSVEGAKQAKEVLDKMGHLGPSAVSVTANSPEAFRKSLAKCQVCKRYYKNLMHKIQHMQYVHPEKWIEEYKGQFLCKICGSNFPNNEKLDEHVMQHKVTFSCSVCREVFNTNELMERHVILTHNMTLNYSCDHCSMSTPSKVKLQSHIEVEHFKRVKYFKCTLCSMIFKDCAQAAEHMAKHKRVNEKKLLPRSDIVKNQDKSETSSFMCASCGLSCKSEKELELHEFIHSDIVKKLSDDEAMVSCAICIFKTSSEAGVTRHLDDHREKIETHSIKCVRCKTTIENFDHLLGHQKSHMTRRNYKCTACERTFPLGDPFLKHIRQHVTKRCAHCLINKTFETEAELMEHIDAKHKKRHPIQLCPTCGAS